MVNYYKILGLPNYASITQIKDAYKAKAKEFHPDTNPQYANNLDYIKNINLAKAELFDPQKKRAYDLKLKYSFVVDSKVSPYKTRNSNPADGRKKRRDAILHQQLLIKKRKYIRKMEKFPFPLRMVGAVVFLLWGIQLIFYNIVANDEVDQFLMRFLGGVLITMSSYIITNLYYKRKYFKNVSHPVKYNFELRSLAIFLFSLIGSIALAFGMKSARETYHLKHYPQYIWATKISNDRNNYMIRYYHGGEFYFKERAISMKYVKNAKGQLLVKISSHDPRIMEIVESVD